MGVTAHIDNINVGQRRRQSEQHAQDRSALLPLSLHVDVLDPQLARHHLRTPCTRRVHLLGAVLNAHCSARSVTAALIGSRNRLRYMSARPARGRLVLTFIEAAGTNAPNLPR